MRFFWLALLIVLLPLRAWTGGPLAAGLHTQALQAQAAHSKPVKLQAHQVPQVTQAPQGHEAGKVHHDRYDHRGPQGHYAHDAGEAHEAHDLHHGHEAEPAHAASSAGSAAADCPGHDGDHAAQGGHGDRCGLGHACQTCADCSACHTPALAQSVAGFRHVQGSPALPLAPRVQFTSADAAPGHKPPIS